MRSSFLSLIQSIRYKMVAQMNGPYSISYFFILLFKTSFTASKLQLYIPESISLLNCQCNVFWPWVATIIAVFRKDCSYRNNFGIRLHDGDLEHNLTKEKIDGNWTRTHNHLVHKRTLNHLANLGNDRAVLWVLFCMVHLTVCSYHVTYAF